MFVPRHNANLRAGASAHPHFSVRMAGPYSFSGSMRSYSVCELVSRHSVSGTDPVVNALLISLLYQSLHNLTASRLQAGLVMAFSISAFVLGVVTVVSGWITSGS